MEIWLNLQISKEKNWWFSFYPKANTPGCTAEACNLNENIEYFNETRFYDFGNFCRSCENQKKFHDKFGFKYDLLADENHEVCENSGVATQKIHGQRIHGNRENYLFI